MTAMIPDEQLRAFLRADLPEADMALIEAAINADPAVCARIEQLAELEESPHDQAIIDAFAPILAAPVPQHLADVPLTAIADPAIAAPVATDPVATAEVIDFAAASRKKRPMAWGFAQYGAMAASLALGLFMGNAVQDGPQGGTSPALVLASADGLQMTPVVETFLSAKGSGDAQALDGLGKASVALTFRTADDRVCRQFSLESAGQTSDAVACRAGAHWQLEAFGQRSQPAGEMRTAGGDAAPAVVTAVDQLIAGDPLTDAAEKAALKGQ
ncbi:hypothetical protein [Novosphingobium sp.]|uniref:hypothetical protein n=1 Tax=Novosphingobium sp. TaxID=1874826 RepID=UPI0026122A8C|nr:hypothetical protein [Novosphingobium sp.]